MFGIVRPCRHSLPDNLKAQWWAHLCGLCLGLRDGHGQAARLTTNVDAAAISVLVEALQVEPTGRRQAGPCPLRGFRSAEVVRADQPGVGHAVAVSLSMAATKVADHVADGDGGIARVPVGPDRLARRWAASGRRAAAAVGFDVEPVQAAIAESGRRERQAGLTFDRYAEPTEQAVAHIVGHTAVLAGRPADAPELAELGRCFGRTVYLLDAVRDQQRDRVRGHFNALAATGHPADGLDRAEVLVAATHRRLTAAFDRLDLARPDLARALFVDQVGRAGRRALDEAARGTAGHRGRARGGGGTAVVVVGTGVALAGRTALSGPVPGRGWKDRLADLSDCLCCCDCCDCCEACELCGSCDACDACDCCGVCDC
jgi:hypothetical protein